MMGGVPPVPLMPYSCQAVPADGPDADLTKRQWEERGEARERKKNREKNQKEEFYSG